MNLGAESALVRALHPESVWGDSEHMLAAIADSVRWLVWSKTRDGEKNRNRPKPLPRPGAGSRRGTDAEINKMPVEQLKAYLQAERA